MAKAAEFRDQLRAAYEAAELMLADVNQALAVNTVKDETLAPTRPVRPGRGGCKKS